MEMKVFHTLPLESIRIRQAVFMEEQGFEDEFDPIDDTASHLVLYQNQKAIATCRLFQQDETSSYILGRLAVNRDCPHIWMRKKLQ